MTARLAVALHCLMGFCKKHELHHPEIEAFLDDLWEFPIVDNTRWKHWEQNHPALVDSAMGNSWPSGFVEYLVSEGISEHIFHNLISNVAEIVFGSFYAAADDDLSYACLARVIEIMNIAGIDPPPPGAFAVSRFSDGGGWGRQLTAVERDAWRILSR